MYNLLYNHCHNLILEYFIPTPAKYSIPISSQSLLLL